MKKTAIDWLIEQIKDDQFKKVKTDLEWSKIFEQAKEIEKQQIMDAYEIGFADAWDDARYDDSPTYAGAEQYYNEIYKLKQDEKDSPNGTD